MAESPCYRIQQNIQRAKDWCALEQRVLDIISAHDFGLVTQAQAESLSRLIREYSHILPQGDYDFTIAEET